MNPLIANRHSDVLIPALIAAEAGRRPDAPAVQARDGELTYTALDSRAHGLALCLRSLGVGPEKVVGTYFTRCTSMIVNALAVLKAGGAYLPIDPALPRDRVAFMLEDSGARVILTEKSLASQVPSGPWRMLIEEPLLASHAQATTNDLPAIAPDNLAYVIYTSGSTGRPKGVEVTHSNLAHLVSWHSQAFAVTAADRASQLASLAFDAAVWEIWPYLAAGATLCLSDSESSEGPEVVRDWLIQNEITIAFVPTPLAETMLELPWPAKTPLRQMLTGGDTLHRFPPPGLPFALVNNYGPTECTVVATSGVVPPRCVSSELPSIGSPVPQAELYILDGELRPVQAGIPGEIFIGGPCVARGYRNRPELSRDRFIPNLFHPGTRMYRTGDLARCLPDGHLAFLGRLDDQIKIRGYRIEPDEIAAVLNGHPDIKTSAVVARDTPAGEKQLAAYIVPTARFHQTLDAAQDFLRAQLPEYMIPRLFVLIDALPLTSSGKVDRAALPTPNGENMLGNAPSASDSALEKRVCEIVCNLLDLSHVNPDDNFFLLGGHSLLGTQLIARIRQAFDVDVPLRFLFDRPSVRELANGIEELLVARVHSMSEEEAKQALCASLDPVSVDPDLCKPQSAA